MVNLASLVDESEFPQERQRVDFGELADIVRLYASSMKDKAAVPEQVREYAAIAQDKSSAAAQKIKDTAFRLYANASNAYNTVTGTVSEKWNGLSRTQKNIGYLIAFGTLAAGTLVLTGCFDGGVEPTATAEPMYQVFAGHLQDGMTPSHLLPEFEGITRDAQTIRDYIHTLNQQGCGYSDPWQIMKQGGQVINDWICLPDMNGNGVIDMVGYDMDASPIKDTYVNLSQLQGNTAISRFAHP